MPDDAYTLPNSWTDARRRMTLLEECYDPSTFRRLTDVGVGDGWSCLEAGAGGGSVAGWLARAVGDRGHVLAVDLDVGLIDAGGASNLEIRQLDLTTDELPVATFDLVHTRMVLTHVPQRAAVLGTLVAALRPGGTLLVEEVDAYPTTSAGNDAFRPAAEVTVALMERAGGDLGWARNLPAALDACGLVDVTAEQEVPHFRGNSPMARWTDLTLAQIREHVVTAGGDPADIDAGRAALADPAQWFHGLATIAARGRRPA